MMRELAIEWIWVVPYSPEYNAIELPFSQVKKVYKSAKLRSLVKDEDFDQSHAIRQSFSSQSVKYIDKCIAHAIKVLYSKST